jgi:hypothetical protein
MKLLRNYESVIQKVLFSHNYILRCNFIFRKQFYFVVPGLKIIDYRNPNNNLESLCLSLNTPPVIPHLFIQRIPIQDIVTNKLNFLAECTDFVSYPKYFPYSIYFSSFKIVFRARIAQSI